MTTLATTRFRLARTGPAGFRLAHTGPTGSRLARTGPTGFRPERSDLTGFRLTGFRLACTAFAALATLAGCLAHTLAFPPGQSLARSAIQDPVCTAAWLRTRRPSGTAWLRGRQRGAWCR